jgi:hypothetical protein
MKRRLGALMLAAAVGGCASTNNSPPAASQPTVRASGQCLGQPANIPGVIGPYGEPVQAMAPYQPSPMLNARQASYLMSQSVPLNMVNMSPGVIQAGAQMPGGAPMPGGPGMITPPGVPMQPGMMTPGGMMMPPPPGMSPSTGANSMWVPPSMAGSMLGMQGNMPPGGAGAMNAPNGMMVPPGSMQFTPGGPFPGGRPPGVVAALGAITGHGPDGGGYSIGRTQVRFVGPSGMKIAWLTQGPDGRPIYSAPMVEAPGRYNFLQASIYRLKLSSIEKRPGLEIYPTLEVVPGNHKTQAFLAHSAVPLEFTDEDFQEVADGKYLVKVIYLPDPQFQELAATGIGEVISTRLEPGADPILEAQRRGSILLVIRMGNVDQEAPNTPPLDSQGQPGGMPHGMMAPGMAPPGMMPQGMGSQGMVPPGMVPPGMVPPGMVPPGMVPPGVVPPNGMPSGSGPSPMPGAGGGMGGPSIPPYLRGGPGLPMPSGPMAPDAGPPTGPSTRPVPPSPMSQLPPPPPTAPMTPAGLAAQSSPGR